MHTTFFDARDNAMREGVIVEFQRKNVVVAIAPGQHGLVDYASINLDGVDADIRERAQQGLGRHEVHVGDAVGNDYDVEQVRQHLSSYYAVRKLNQWHG